LDDAWLRLRAHAPGLSDESLRQAPTIVLVATDFDRNLSTTAAFLIDLGLDVQFIRVQAYRTNAGEVLITASRIFPPDNMEDWVLAPSTKEQQEKRTDAARQQAVVKRLIEAGALAEGTVVTLRPDVSKAIDEQIQAWVDAEPKRGRATWANRPGTPLVWEGDGKGYSPSALLGKIVKDVTGESRSVRGPQSWTDAKGRTLVQLADELPQKG
jgi:hypothetical protein